MHPNIKKNVLFVPGIAKTMIPYYHQMRKIAYRSVKLKVVSHSDFSHTVTYYYFTPRLLKSKCFSHIFSGLLSYYLQSCEIKS